MYSKVKGEGTYNFVIWNSEKLKMLGLTEDSDDDAKEYFETTKRAQEQKNLANEVDILPMPKGRGF